MATTTNTTFAEHDKLGPLGSRAHVLGQDGELRRALVADFAAAAEAARDAAGSVDAGAGEAVHSYRKALRRARAVLALVGPALPKSERRAVRRALREARRALGTARDHNVAPDTLSQLPLDPVERETAAAIIRAAEEASTPVPEIKQLLAEGAARAAAQVVAIEAALPPSIDWSDIARGVRGTYDEARRARQAAKRSKRAFHTWRRRSKELVYQLELLAGYGGPHLNELYREVEGATAAQGPVVDLIMVRDFIRTYDQGLAEGAAEQLLDAIDAQLDELAPTARAAAKPAFRRKPRKFERRLTKAMKRDLEPPAPADEHVA
jgi:CHAD domain-containing protein